MITVTVTLTEAQAKQALEGLALRIEHMAARQGEHTPDEHEAAQAAIAAITAASIATSQPAEVHATTREQILTTIVYGGIPLTQLQQLTRIDIAHLHATLRALEAEHYLLVIHRCGSDAEWVMPLRRAVHR